MFRSKLNKTVLWEVSVDYPGIKPGEKECLFMNEQSAMNHINKHKKLFIIDKVKRFVVHKKQILRNTTYYYSTANKREAVSICEDFLGCVHPGLTIKLVCARILQIEDHLKRILPHSKNNSSRRSQHDLMDILAFCRRETGRVVIKNKQYKMAL